MKLFFLHRCMYGILVILRSAVFAVYPKQVEMSRAPIAENTIRLLIDIER